VPSLWRPYRGAEAFLRLHPGVRFAHPRLHLFSPSGAMSPRADLPRQGRQIVAPVSDSEPGDTGTNSVEPQRGKRNQNDSITPRSLLSELQLESEYCLSRGRERCGGGAGCGDTGFGKLAFPVTAVTANWYLLEIRLTVS
jgi:hypothetical protein